MKVDDKKVEFELENLLRVREWIKAGRPSGAFDGVLCVIADTLDYALGGNDAFLSIGMTREKDALLMTVKYGRARLYAGGGSLSGISTDAEKLL